MVTFYYRIENKRDKDLFFSYVWIKKFKVLILRKLVVVDTTIVLMLLNFQAK